MELMPLIAILGVFGVSILGGVVIFAKWHDRREARSR